MAANQRNARKSTGPRTLEGNAVSSRNAFKHGLTAGQLLLPGKDFEEFDELRLAIFRDLQPNSVTATQIAERIVSLILRLRRIPAFEVALFDWTAYLQREIYDHETSLS